MRNGNTTATCTDSVTREPGTMLVTEGNAVVS